MTFSTVPMRFPLQLLFWQRRFNWCRELKTRLPRTAEVEFRQVQDQDECLATVQNEMLPGLAILEVDSTCDLPTLQLIVDLSKLHWKSVVVGSSELRSQACRWRQAGAIEVATSVFDLDRVVRLIDRMLVNRPATQVSWQTELLSRLPWKSRLNSAD